MSFSRDWDRQWIAQDMRSDDGTAVRILRPPKCPKCGRLSLHLGPMGLYCEEGDCEWEQGEDPAKGGA